MNDEKDTGNPPSLGKSDPPNSRLASLISEQTERILRKIGELEDRLSPKHRVAAALAEVFAAMIPDDEPAREIPDGWAPVALAINPATGEFLTIAGPRSEPDGRVEALETMLARQLQNTVASTIGAVREACDFCSRAIRARCECVNGCRLSVEHEDEPGAVSARVKKLEDGSED